MTQNKKRRLRSPPYPAISLKDAVGRALVIHDKEGRNPAPLIAIANAWGHASEKSGTFLTSISALKQYGLIEYIGTGAARKVSLTDDAITILLDTREGNKPECLIKAFNTPKIFAFLFNEFNNTLPSDDTLKSTLVVDRNFSERAANDVIRNYKASIEYAGVLYEGMNDFEDESEDEFDSSPEEVSQSSSTSKAGMSKIGKGEKELFKFQLSEGGTVRILISGKHPTQRDIDKVIKLLEIQKDVFPLADSVRPE